MRTTPGMLTTRRLLHASVLLVLGTGARHADAQACLGYPSFAAGPVRAEVGAAFADGMSAFGGGLAFGQPAGFFASGAVTRRSYTVTRLGYEDADEPATAFGAQAGYAFSVDPDATFSFCPILGFSYEAGPDFEFQGIAVDVSTMAVSGGVAVGGSVAASPRFSFVPFGSFALARATTEVDGELGGLTTVATERETYGLVTLGTGLVFDRMITLRPAVSIPVGHEEAETSFGVGLSVNFGGRSAASSRRAGITPR